MKILLIMPGTPILTPYSRFGPTVPPPPPPKKKYNVIERRLKKCIKFFLFLYAFSTVVQCHIRDDYYARTQGHEKKSKQFTFQPQDVFALMFRIRLNMAHKCPVGHIKNAPIIFLPISQNWQKIWQIFRFFKRHFS